MSIANRKAELLKFIEARDKATKGPWEERPSTLYCHPEVIQSGHCKHDKLVSTNCKTGEETIVGCTGVPNFNWVQVLGPTMWTSDRDLNYHNLDKDFFANEDANFIALAANESAKIAQQLIDAIDVIEFYSEGNGPSSADIGELQTAPFNFDHGKKARKLLAKLAEESS